MRVHARSRGVPGSPLCGPGGALPGAQPGRCDTRTDTRERDYSDRAEDRKRSCDESRIRIRISPHTSIHEARSSRSRPSRLRASRAAFSLLGTPRGGSFFGFRGRTRDVSHCANIFAGSRCYVFLFSSSQAFTVYGTDKGSTHAIIVQPLKTHLYFAIASLIFSSLAPENSPSFSPFL
jgi:hypothetical protein